LAFGSGNSTSKAGRTSFVVTAGSCREAAGRFNVKTEIKLGWCEAGGGTRIEEDAEDWMG